MIRKRNVLLALLMSLPAMTVRGDELTPKIDALFSKWDKPDAPGAGRGRGEGG